MDPRITASESIKRFFVSPTKLIELARCNGPVSWIEPSTDMGPLIKHLSDTLTDPPRNDSFETEHAHNDPHPPVETLRSTITSSVTDRDSPTKHDPSTVTSFPN
jgi:hypothetical protein